jgi:hypothetical protein
MGLGSKHSHYRLTKAACQKEAWKLRVQGWTLVEIAQHLGWSKTQIGDDLKDAYAEYRAAWKEEAQDVARLDLEGIDALILSHLPGAQATRPCCFVSRSLGGDDVDAPPLAVELDDAVDQRE